MNTKDVFRDFGEGPIVRPVQAIDWWWGGVATLALVSLLGLTSMLDARSQRLHTAQAVEQRVRDEMKMTVVAAYRQGRTDTLEAVGCVRSLEPRP